MFIYRSWPSEVTRKYKTAQGVIRRINLDFPDIHGTPHVFYGKTETSPERMMVPVPKPTVHDIRSVAQHRTVLRRKVFFLPGNPLGWELHGEEIIIRWDDE